MTVSLPETWILPNDYLQVNSELWNMPRKLLATYLCDQGAELVKVTLSVRRQTQLANPFVELVCSIERVLKY